MLLGVIVLMVLVFLVSRRASGPLPTPPNWLTDFEVARGKAAGEGKLILVDFGASWCPACREMTRDVLPDASVAKALDGFVPVKIDVDTERDLAVRFRVDPIPAFIVLDSAGREVHRFEGYRDAREFVAELARARANLPTTRP